MKPCVLSSGHHYLAPVKMAQILIVVHLSCFQHITTLTTWDCAKTCSVSHTQQGMLVPWQNTRMKEQKTAKLSKPAAWTAAVGACIVGTVTTSHHSNHQTCKLFVFRCALSLNKSFFSSVPPSVLHFDSGHQHQPCSTPPPPAPPSPLHILVLCFRYAHEKTRKDGDNRAPARIMSPQRKMQLGPRVIEERWWWSCFKVVRDDPQSHLISPPPPAGISLLTHTHTHKAVMSTYTRKQLCRQMFRAFFFLLFITKAFQYASFLLSVWVGSFTYAATFTASLSIGSLSLTLRHSNVDRNYASPETKARLFTYWFYI